MLPAMFGMGGTEILVILIVALIFLGPDKLPEAAKQISKGIRDIKKQSRALQQTIEDDENIGGALRDLRSALRGEEPPAPRPKPKQIDAVATPDPVAPAAALIASGDAPATDAPAGEHAAEAAAASEVASAPAPARDPHDHDAEVAANVFADSFESGHMTSPATTAPVAAPAAGEAAAPQAPKLTLPPTAGEPAEAIASTAADADLASLVKPAPNTIARGAATSAPPSATPVATSAATTDAAPAAAEPSEPEHG